MIDRVRMTYFARILAITGLLLLPFQSAQALAEKASVKVIYAGWLLAVPGKPPLKDQTVVVRGGHIVAIRGGRVPAADIDPSADVVDLSDRFVMPGLSDVHYHITMGEMSDRRSATPIARIAALSLASASQATALLMAGITTIRDVGDESNAISFQLRDGIARGEIAGPRIFAAGRIISRTQGHGAETRSALQFLMPVELGGCDGVESCRRAVRENIGDGSWADLIKFTGSGSSSEPWGTSGAVPTSFDDEVDAIVGAAGQLGRKVAVHAHSAASINQALRAGAFTIEHGTYFDAESAKLFKLHNAYMVPTSYIGEFLLSDPRIRARNTPEDWRRIEVSAVDQQQVAGRAWRAGIKLGVGTDSGFESDPSNTAREIELFVKDGIPTADALAAATTNNAAIVGHSNDMGQIAIGYVADIIAMPGNPLVDPSVLHNVSFVMKNGQIFRNAVAAADTQKVQ